MIYPAELYKVADSGPYTLASYTSTDPKVRRISILFTNAIMEVANVMLRQPMAAMTQAFVKDVKAMKAVPSADLYRLGFAPSRILEVSQRALYVKAPKKKTTDPDELFLCASKGKLQEIVNTIKAPLSLPRNLKPGWLLLLDLAQRINSILFSCYWPEMQALVWFEQVTKQQIFGAGPDLEGRLVNAIGIFALHKVIKEAKFDVRDTLALFSVLEKQVADGATEDAKFLEKYRKEVYQDAIDNGSDLPRDPSKAGMTW
jgi:hypothetical protein